MTGLKKWTSGQKNALLKFQKFPMKKTLYESFYPVPERGKVASCRRPHPAGRDGARGIRNSNLSRLHKICTRQNCYPNFPLLNVLEILKNFFQEVFKQGLGQSPKVLNRLSLKSHDLSQRLSDARRRRYHHLCKRNSVPDYRIKNICKRLAKRNTMWYTNSRDTKGGF